MIIYAVMYNWYTSESDDEILSLHKTKKGADEAIKKDKEFKENEDKKYWSESNAPYPNKNSMVHEWSVEEYELFD